MSEFKKNQLDRTGFIHIWKTIEAMLGTKVDKIEGFGLSSNDYTTEEKKKLASLSDPKPATTENNGLMSSADKAKLDGIEAGANKSEEDPTIILNKLNPSDKPVTDDTNLIVKNSEGVYSRSPLILLWNWIKAKTDTLYAAAGHNHKVNELENYNTHVYSPILNRTKRTVLAAPTGADGPATFRALDKNDVGLGNVDNTPDSEKTVLKSATLSGFTSRSSQTWGNQTGTFIHGENDETGGSFAFRRDNPENGQMSMIIDGRFYQDEGRYMVLDTNNFSSYALPVNGTADFANGTVFDKEQWVSLTDLDQNTWYPVVSMRTIPYSGLRHIKCNVQLNSSSKPSWSTHNGGFTVNLDMLVTAAGWGTTSANSICLDNSYHWTTSNANPAGYSQMTNGSVAVFWLRGGGRYRLYADWDASWDVKTSTYTSSGQSVAPTKSYPGVNYNKASLDDLANNGVVASGSNYVRFGDGTQICWGRIGVGSSAGGYQAGGWGSFPVAFTNTSYMAATCGNDSWGTMNNMGWTGVMPSSKDTGGIGISIASGSASGYVQYIVIGRWK